MRDDAAQAPSVDRPTGVNREGITEQLDRVLPASPVPLAREERNKNRDLQYQPWSRNDEAVWEIEVGRGGGLGKRGGGGAHLQKENGRFIREPPAAVRLHGHFKATHTDMLSG